MSAPVPEPFASAVRPVAWIYRGAVAARNAWFDRAGGACRLEIPVVSVGNVVVGGTGKSPVVHWIARQYRRAGVHPAIALRGYAATQGNSDEADEYRRLLPGVPVCVGADRAAAIAAARAAGETFDVVILDDGFQHRRLARALDLVLVDSRRPELDGRLLPAGWLREPPSSLRRADAVVVTHADGVDAALAGRIEQLHGKPPVAWLRHVWAGLEMYRNGSMDTVDDAWLAERRVATIFGVGNPQGIAGQVERLGAVIATAVPARDHQVYDQRLAARLAAACRGLDALVTTGKDWVKLRRVIDSSFPVPVVVPRLDIQVMAGGSELARLLREVVARHPGARPPSPVPPASPVSK